jgi:hypothetical protein
MRKLSYFALSAAILAFSLGADARGAELEGAIQYPPPPSERMPNRHRRLELCRSWYPRSVSYWASAGRARHPVRDYFWSARRSQDLEHRRQPQAGVSSATVI